MSRVLDEESLEFQIKLKRFKGVNYDKE